MNNGRWLQYKIHISVRPIDLLFPFRALWQEFFSARVVDLWNKLDDSTDSVDNVRAFPRKLVKLVVCSGSNTDYKSSEPLKTLVMLCFVMLCLCYVMYVLLCLCYVMFMLCYGMACYVM